MIYIPNIAKEDYPELKTIMWPHLPQTYLEWPELCVELAAEGGENGFLGIKVDPDEFADFIAMTGRLPDLRSLLLFCDRGRDRKLHSTHQVVDLELGR